MRWSSSTRFDRRYARTVRRHTLAGQRRIYVRLLQAGVIPIIFALAAPPLAADGALDARRARYIFRFSAALWYASFSSNPWRTAGPTSFTMVLFTYFYTAVPSSRTASRRTCRSPARSSGVRGRGQNTRQVVTASRSPGLFPRPHRVSPSIIQGSRALRRSC